MFAPDDDDGECDAWVDETAPRAAPKPKLARKRPNQAPLPLEAQDDMAQFKAELEREVEASLRQTEKKRKRTNKATFKSKRARTIADKAARENNAQRGIGTKTTNKESIEAYIQSMINDNPDVDAEQLRKDILQAHQECDAACKKFDEIMATVTPTYEHVKYYSDILNRAETTKFPGKRILVNLSKALRRCLYEVDRQLKTSDARSRTYISLLARTEALAQHVAGSGRPTTASGLPPSARASRSTASTTTSSAMVLYGGGVGSQLVTTGDDGQLVVGDSAKPVQFAVPLGNGRGLVEVRATTAEQVLTGQLNESYLECSLARQNHMPVLTEEGELTRRTQHKRVSQLRKALEARTSMSAIHAAANRLMAPEKSAPARIAAPGRRGIAAK